MDMAALQRLAVQKHCLRRCALPCPFLNNFFSDCAFSQPFVIPVVFPHARAL
jgi:hypothetical protein